ncbi:unnamed protein product [Porites lobata]|uniref:Uncharacterized protein n=1 Tax=Porites lobata TaxID=104759 RepID=A0ABN8QNG6_9CNID|nr:unnamed protein product [Porites lobata]
MAMATEQDHPTSKPPLKSVMQWKPEHDAIFLREVLASDLYSTRKGSSEKEKIWSQLAEKLNEVSSWIFRTGKFIVTQKSLRDRLKLLTQKHKQKMRSEERASGIDPEMTEIDVMLEEICEKEEVAEEEDETKKKKAKAEKESAEKMRLKAMEKLSESQKRKDRNEEARPKKSRKSIGDAVSYLQEKSKQEIALRKEEIELKKQEEGRIAHLSEQQLKMQQEMLQMIQQQHQNQQRQQQEQQRQQERLQQQQLQTMRSILTQQQQQSQAMLSLFEKFAPKKDP